MNMAAERVTQSHDLRQLLQGMADAPAIELHGISDDSRTVRKGDAFFALQGDRSHGLDYLEKVLEAGAAAVIWDPQTRVLDKTVDATALIPLEELGGHLGEIANRWYGAPSKALQVSAVTGTNGKTTVAWLLAACMRELGQKCGYIGTLGAGLEEPEETGGLTTPTCLQLHSLFSAFRNGGASAATLEVSSHALQQDRIAGVHLDSAIFTNLSRDHIDYHGDMQNYGETKARLFLDHDLQHRIICTDTEFGQSLARRCRGHVVTVATALRSNAVDLPGLCTTAIRGTATGSQVSFRSTWGDGEYALRMPGHYNVANASLALAQLLSWGVSLSDACDALGKVNGPPGRMQRVQAPGGPTVYVDFAHTPDGLQATLRALRPHCRGKLWCVFGCGGDRDRGKRQQMGAAAARCADVAIVTSDNPRSENPGSIIEDVLQAMPAHTRAIEDRADAIACAVAEAADDDVVLLAGKGHEDFQVVGDERLPFSDYHTAMLSLAARDPLERGHDD
jgi:UDP-N-acetylmuramoyl-L-alanyl-D-glutamate--2,6-diaminopimelate ligase